jgi:hypothetical protein
MNQLGDSSMVVKTDVLNLEHAADGCNPQSGLIRNHFASLLFLHGEIAARCFDFQCVEPASGSKATS